MAKKSYLVTQLAGPTVAGQRSPGASKTIELTEGQAEHPLRLGHIADPSNQPFGGKGDHDGNGKVGGSKKKS